MGFYSRHILPHVLDCACATKPIRKQREKVVPFAKGDVVEIGIGSGHNLPYYDQANVRSLIGIDPDEYVWKKSAKKRELFKKPLKRLGLSGEDIPLGDETADTVVVTYSLCTIPDPVRALHEMRRILKPGGELILTEHGQAPDDKTRRWQNRIDPVWKKISGGCHSGRDICSILHAGGFSPQNIEHDYIPGPKILSYHYWGRIKKTG
ncbi:MAG TPA: class I SAM-dependent methyltransferase [Hellea balneolensis]|uniref:Class I SAM-dependent methyltransferase n=1 Tax=Hellea balneolensis TaxID=287478 RepID=A0A7C5QZZ7_9PROT|nr:class I SAM-dependent methyltransferase [Hellea balneolensis]